MNFYIVLTGITTNLLTLLQLLNANPKHSIGHVDANYSDDHSESVSDTSRDQKNKDTCREKVHSSEGRPRTKEKSVVHNMFSYVISNISGSSKKCKQKEVCYEEIGCFNLEPPWTGPKRSLPTPQSPNEIEVEFYIMSRNTREKSKSDLKAETTYFYVPILDHLEKMDYRSSRKRTVVHVHGLYFDPDYSWNYMKNLAAAYLLREDANIIFVEWGRHMLKNTYSQWVANSRIIGAIAARFIEHLISLTNLTVNQIHIVGFSLGGHIAGYIGKRISNAYRITALDPSQLLFENADPMYRLHLTDAQHVDVLHTNGEPLFPFFGLGIRAAIGHVDFYFNGGTHQPGCVVDAGVVLKNFLKLRLSEVFVDGAAFYMVACSHLRVLDYWIEAVKNFDCTLWGIEKMNCNPIGFRQRLIKPNCKKYACTSVGLDTFNFDKFGPFDVNTNLKPPYCNVKLHNRFTHLTHVELNSV